MTILRGMIKIPTEISGFFEQIHFQNYPKIAIPQSFKDDRGTIMNISDGILGDVAIIESVKNSVRANHVHKSDWHLSFCMTGSLVYSFEDSIGNVSSTEISKGELFFTPEAVPHRMDFREDTVLVVVSKNSRLQEKYEEDTKKHFLEPQRRQ
jgi:dTDP-4-dehydrorhamnose 3,5-epimerase-like enzyme